MSFSTVRLSQSDAEPFVELAGAGLDREYPNKPGTVLTSAADLAPPSEITPTFFGHFDWHSSVHGHWTLVRLLRLFPSAVWAEPVREALDRKLTAANLLIEAANLRRNPSFERMYGWAWALRLGLELRSTGGDHADRWATAFEPVEAVIVHNALTYLPKLDWPIRCGFHPESSFALSQMLDWARAAHEPRLEELAIAKATSFYGSDVDYPVHYEPSGNDFFSAGLNEADLLRRVLPADEYREWFDGFFPNGLGNLAEPVRASDLGDGHLVHLVGLNLSRAWTLRGINSVLGRPELAAIAERHETAGLRDAISGSYEGDHWLGTFAVYLLTGAGE